MLRVLMRLGFEHPPSGERGTCYVLSCTTVGRNGHARVERLVGGSTCELEWGR